MAYYRKNKRRFDPRYFMNERLEEDGLEEMHISDPEPDWRRPQEGEDDSPEARRRAFHPETIRQRVERGLESFLDKEAVALHHLDAGYEEQEEINARNEKFNMKEGCGDVEELPWVEIDGGKLTASDDSEQSLADIVRTGQAWKDMGIEIVGGRKDVLSALKIEISASEPLPQLMDEEPPLEE